MKKWRRLVLVGVAALILAAGVALDFTVRAQEAEDGTLADRIYIGEICVGGMTEEEAAAAVEAYVADLGNTKVTLAAGKNTVETTAGELGLSWANPESVKEAAGVGKSGNLIERYMAMKDLEYEDKVYEISYTVDSMKVAQVLENNMESLNTEAMDAGLSRVDGEFVITPGSQGVTVNIADSVKLVEEYFVTEWEEKEASVELAAEIVEPRGTEEELSKVTDVLGSFHTDFSSSDGGRANNVSRGASLVNGSVVYPGEQFSVHDAISPTTAENGYQMAGAYENGQTIQAYGGGVCQVSTTLYNAAIRAELEVVERSPHSMTVTYVEPSMDAAIAGTYKDFKFINNTDAPIYIEGYTVGRTIYFTIYGHETRPANREVSFFSETTSSSDPGVQFRATNAPIGSITRVQGAHTGKNARLWKVVKVDGVEVSREVFNTSSYRPSPAIYEVGTASGNANAVANINAAIATQDEATIRAAAAAWNDEAVAAAAAAAAAAQAEADRIAAEQAAQDAANQAGQGIDPNAVPAP